MGEDEPNSSDRILRGPRKPGGYYGHNIIDEANEPENEAVGVTKRLDERLILTRLVFIICSLEKWQFWIFLSSNSDINFKFGKS